MSQDITTELRNLIARSSDCVWRRDVDGYAQCWTSHGSWHILGEVVRGRDAIAARWSELMTPYPRVWQLAHNIVFGLDRVQPSGRLYLEETLLDPVGHVSILKGVYHDDYMFEDGAWRFARRHIDIGYLGPHDFSGRWFSMIDYGPAPYDPDPSRPATPSMAEAFGAGA